MKISEYYCRNKSKNNNSDNPLTSSRIDGGTKYTPFTRAIFFILLIHEGSHREVYQEFQPSYDIFHRVAQTGGSMHP